MRGAPLFDAMDNITNANEIYCWPVRRPSFSTQWCKVRLYINNHRLQQLGEMTCCVPIKVTFYRLILLMAS